MVILAAVDVQARSDRRASGRARNTTVRDLVRLGQPQVSGARSHRRASHLDAALVPVSRSTTAASRPRCARAPELTDPRGPSSVASDCAIASRAALTSSAAPSCAGRSRTTMELTSPPTPLSVEQGVRQPVPQRGDDVAVEAGAEGVQADRASSLIGGIASALYTTRRPGRTRPAPRPPVLRRRGIRHVGRHRQPAAKTGDLALATSSSRAAVRAASTTRRASRALASTVDRRARTRPRPPRHLVPQHHLAQHPFRHGGLRAAIRFRHCGGTPSRGRSTPAVRLSGRTGHLHARPSSSVRSRVSRCQRICT